MTKIVKKMKKILIIFGTRPEAIKLAPLINEFKKNTDFFETKICVTGQHRQMLKNIFAFFEINPDYNLDIMKKNQTLNYISSSLIKKLDQIIKSYQPDLVLVQGDTTTATIASLAAFYSNVRVGHIEAGLRTYNKLSPYPEEINRQIITKIADYHFAPTKEAQKNLKKEQIEKDKIIITGNTIIDSLRLTEKKLKNYTNDEIEKLKKIIKTNKKIILVTGHRRENLENGLNNVCEALKKLAKENKDLQIIYPVHPNPKVQKIVKNSLANTKNIKLTKPLSYPSFV